jgi:hypothetical protein
MNLKKGEVWICREPYCAAEIEVVRSANTNCHGKYTLRCCCGKELVLKEDAANNKQREPVAQESRRT